MRRDRVALERRRWQAARLLEQGLTEAEVARRLGVHRQSVNRWAKALKVEGRTGLRRAPRAGRPSKLGEARRTLVEGHVQDKWHEYRIQRQARMAYRGHRDDLQDIRPTV